MLYSHQKNVANTGSSMRYFFIISMCSFDYQFLKFIVKFDRLQDPNLIVKGRR